MAGRVIRLRRRLHVHHLITKLELGGAQQNTLYCVRHHDRSRFQVSLGAGPGGFLDSAARSIPCAQVTFFPHLRRELRPWDDAAFYFRFRSFLRRRRVDILHTHSSKAGILGRLAAAHARTPVVIHTVHGWGFHDRQSPLIRRMYIGLERLAARRTHRLFAVSRENRARGLKELIGRPSQYRIVRSGIDIAAFRTSRRSGAKIRQELGIARGEVVVGTVGNFKPQKAPFDFVHAARLIAQKIPQARFVMVGDGELRRESEILAGNLGLRARMVFTGWRTDIPELLRAFDVFVLTSLFEGLPRSVLQAAVAGLPVVATAAGGTPEAIRHGVSGYVVAVHNMADLAGKTAGLLANLARARRMGRAGRALIGREFEIKTMLHDIETNYLELAENTRLL